MEGVMKTIKSSKNALIYKDFHRKSVNEDVSIKIYFPKTYKFSFAQKILSHHQSINHENVIRILDFEEKEDKKIYIATEYFKTSLLGF